MVGYFWLIQQTFSCSFVCVSQKHFGQAVLPPPVCCARGQLPPLPHPLLSYARHCCNNNNSTITTSNETSSICVCHDTLQTTSSFTDTVINKVPVAKHSLLHTDVRLPFPCFGTRPQQIGLLQQSPDQLASHSHPASPVSPKCRSKAHFQPQTL